MNREIKQLINAIKAEDERLRKTIAELRKQVDTEPDPELVKKDAHIEKLRGRISELEESLRLSSGERDAAIAKLVRLKGLAK